MADELYNQTSVFIREIHPKGLLSFGPDSKAISLNNLNVLIGPNGSGKSNFIDVISLLRGTAKDIQEVIRKGGGMTEWVNKNSSKKGEFLLSTFIHYAKNSKGVINHIFFLKQTDSSFIFSAEAIANNLITRDDDNKIETYYAKSPNSEGFFFNNGKIESGKSENIDKFQSILSQRRDPDNYPEITFLAIQYEKIRIYRDWQFGRNTIFRTPQQSDSRNDRLEEDFSNLGLILNKLIGNPKVKPELIKRLKDLYDGITDLHVSIEGGAVQVFILEGENSIPASRLSDGTLRYLCLLCILLDPEPPPLICIEEPELGLHPDIIPKLRDLLVEASERTQLIVTTHSDLLVDGFSTTPERIIICEKENGQTVMKRLDSEKLAIWLEDFSLGQLWMDGEIGGNRW